VLLSGCPSLYYQGAYFISGLPLLVMRQKTTNEYLLGINDQPGGLPQGAAKKT
jgi:hypothetical protein